jgi:hypothetical protein
LLAITRGSSLVPLLQRVLGFSLFPHGLKPFCKTYSALRLFITVHISPPLSLAYPCISHSASLEALPRPSCIPCVFLTILFIPTHPVHAGPFDVSKLASLLARFHHPHSSSTVKIISKLFRLLAIAIAA